MITANTYFQYIAIEVVRRISVNFFRLKNVGSYKSTVAVPCCTLCIPAPNDSYFRLKAGKINLFY
jgi:hypothetical protein